MSCKCSNENVKESFKFCPYCGEGFTKPLKRYRFEGQNFNGKKGYAIKSSEFRAPREGEYFLSGCTPIAYKAYHDMTEEYHIAKIILTD